MVDPVLRGHLALEAMIVELIQTIDNTEDVWKWSFIKKTQFLLANDILSDSQKDAYDRFNQVRNDFAHIFDHSISNQELLALARELEGFGIEFSDSIGSYSEEEALEYYSDKEGIMSEIIWCLLFDVAFVLQENGGRSII